MLSADCGAGEGHERLAVDQPTVARCVSIVSLYSDFVFHAVDIDVDAASTDQLRRIGIVYMRLCAGGTSAPAAA